MLHGYVQQQCLTGLPPNLRSINLIASIYRKSWFTKPHEDIQYWRTPQQHQLSIVLSPAAIPRSNDFSVICQRRIMCPVSRETQLLLRGMKALVSRGLRTRHCLRSCIKPLHGCALCRDSRLASFANVACVHTAAARLRLCLSL